MKTAAFHTLGCKVNQYDTQAMLEKFRAAGYEIVPFDADADVYVINTCTVTGTGDKKSLQLARRLRREHPDSALILAGCLAQRKPEDLLETGARLVIGTQHRGEVVELLEKALRENTSINAVNELNATTPFEPLTITSQEEHTRATLKIQEGCNNHCTYCIIPSVRGPIRSRPVDEIRAEAERLAQAGFTELVLTGIHLTSYGRDFTPRQTLLDAIRAVQDVPGVRRIRLGSLEPTVATVEFAQALRTMDKVCPQFHLALQSGSDTVLQRMAPLQHAHVSAGDGKPARRLPDGGVHNGCIDWLPWRNGSRVRGNARFHPRSPLCQDSCLPLLPARRHESRRDARTALERREGTPCAPVDCRGRRNGKAVPGAVGQ